MVNLLKNEDTATSDEVYSVSFTYEHITQDIAQATVIAGMPLRNTYMELIEKLQLN